MPLTSLEEVLNEQLKDLYSAENQIIKALPKMAKAASSPDLRAALEEHLEETRGQVERLDQVMELVGATGKGKKCKGMEGLLEEGKEALDEKGDAMPAALDAAIIAACQRVEHYEIAAYGTVCTYAKQLGQREALDLLKETLNEEKQADEKLSEIGRQVNLDAAEAPQEEPETRKSGRKTRTARS